MSAEQSDMSAAINEKSDATTASETSPGRTTARPYAWTNRLMRGGILLLYPLIDFIGIFGCCALAYYTYDLLNIGKQMYYPPEVLLPVCALTGALTCIVLLFTGAYSRESSLLNVVEMRAVIKGVLIAFLLFTLATFGMRLHPARYVVTLAFSYCMVFMVIQRTMLHHLHARIGRLLAIQKRVLIYGAGEIGTALYRHLVNSPRLNFLPLGFIDDDPVKLGRQLNSCGFNTNQCVEVLGDFAHMEKIIRNHRAEFLFVTISSISNEHLEKIIAMTRKLDIRVRFIPNLYRAFLHRLKIAQIGPFPLIEEIDPTHNHYKYFKRIFDFLLALLLLPLILPLFLLIALIIKTDSPGPAIFRQKRVGKNGRLFQMYKFRSLYVESDVYSENPNTPKDPRITRFGKILRRTSLDELPQIWNVLRGEMSFVGPRPEMPFLVDRYNELQQERLKVVPGITGLWQLSGHRKASIHEYMDYDLYYICNMSFFLDIAILIETFFFAFRGI